METTITGRTVIISNRLPYTIEKRNGRLELRKSSGGLVSAMDAVVSDDPDTLWIGAASFSEETWEEFLALHPQEAKTIVPVFLDDATERNYYHGFSNTIIWPLFHYFPSYAIYKEEYYEAYVRANRTFAEVAAAHVKDEDVVWIHDYHLMLLPGLLKRRNKKVGVGFFLHIPFPSYEILKHIPESWRNRILTSLLNADVIGFHTKEYVSHFERSLSFFLGVEMEKNATTYGSSTVVIKSYPISIDFEKFSKAFDAPAVKKARTQIRSRYKNVKIIFSVDRLDYTKGVVNRLEAFEELLNEYPELRQKITFIINVVPSRDKHKKYKERRRLIEEKISHINGLYGSVQWTPIIYQYSHLSFTQLLSFYTSCDVALVTPLRDGMNLVAKEFVASRKDNRGVLVLSEFAGAAHELTQAIQVNPNDVNLMKEALRSALSRTEEDQELAMTHMRETVKNNDITKWASEFMNDLKTNRNLNLRSNIRIMTFEERNELLSNFTNAERKLILLDYDGTIVPYYDDPADARPSERTKRMLRELAAVSKVMIISGRPSATLEQWFEGIPVDLVSEHGCYHKEYNSDSWTESPLNSSAWKPKVRDVFSKYQDLFDGTFIEEKDHAVTFHFRKALNIDEQQMIQDICRDLRICNSTDQFNVLLGNKIIEVKNINADKGTFVSNFLHDKDFDFVLAIGDDATDEDLFRKLTGNHHFTIRVGLSNTLAMFNLVGVSNVHSFLEQLQLAVNAEAGKKNLPV